MTFGLSELPSPLPGICGPVDWPSDWSVISELMLLLAKASTIILIGLVASMPFLTVMTTGMVALQGLELARSGVATLRAMRVVVAGRDAGAGSQEAAVGATVSASVV